MGLLILTEVIAKKRRERQFEHHHTAVPEAKPFLDVSTL
jgi:hypothetical protein